MNPIEDILNMVATEAADMAPIKYEPRPPIAMILLCPYCHTQHVDAPEPEIGWTNPPHKSHLCHACGAIWRPADVPTTGVKAIETKGDADRFPTHTSAPVTLPLSIQRVGPGEYAMFTANGLRCAHIEGTAFAKWLCERANGNYVLAWGAGITNER